MEGVPLPPIRAGGGEVKWETTMEKAIERATRDLRKPSPEAAAQVRPGHVEYVSKADAAAIVERIITDLLQEASA